PNNPNAPAMMYAAASVYYDFGHYKEGNQRYFRFLRKYPTNEFAKVAAARMFEYEKLQGDNKSYVALKKRLAEVGPIRAAPELAPYFALPKKPTKKPAKKPEKDQDSPPNADIVDENEGDSNIAPVSDESGEATDQTADSE